MALTGAWQIKTITASTGKCMLPTIAPELRNKIYELVLLEEDIICVDKKLRVPALLQVCRQIRTDTLAMWYERNTFCFTIMHCNPGLILRFDELIMATELVNNTAVEMRSFVKGKPNWGNLMKWCRAVYLQDALALVKDDGRDDGRTEKLTAVITAATTLARRFFHASGSWRKCEAALGDLRFAVGKYDPRWLD
ncbi:hypothetical protein LTR17_002132 [Elasticomyces elasticus]|nr:hypothetical protein LTR17_002132 [Elasticomyces elasticus]